MKFKIKKGALLESLNYVSKALSSRNIIPVLNGIKFELVKEGLYLTATDNDMTIKSFIDKKDIKEIKEEGSSIIYGKFILDIVRKLPGEDILIETIDGNKAIISTTNAKYNLNCFDINDFPNIEIKLTENPIKVLTGVFKEIINQTSFATSTQESRTLLTGINVKILGDYLECVATDSYRLSKKILKLDKQIEENINIVIPSRNITELIKNIEDDTDTLEMHLFSNKILFKYKNILFQSSLLNGTYPNTDSFVPTEFNTELTLNLEDFTSAIDRASLLTQSKEKNIVQLEIKEEKIVITSSSAEIGKVEEIMKLEKIKGETMNISFSAKYMIDALKTFNGKNIKLLLNGEIKPIIIRDEKSEDLTQLILPIKTY
jgi:DNA polymerase-3 subunit beta